MNIKLLPLPLDDVSVTSVQLFEGIGVQLLVASKDGLSVITQGKPTPEIIPTMKLGGSGATWEARRLEDGSFTAVYTQPGSAVCWVMSKRSGESEGIRLHTEAFAVYLQPHYVKGPVSESRVTAIQHKGGLAQVVLFTRDPSTRLASTVRIGGTAESIMDARLLQDSAGYWLFLLAAAPGEAGSADPRVTATGSRMAGLLHAVRLDGKLNPIRNSIQVLSGRPIYEFDIEPAPDDQIAIFATTPAGAIYARGALKDIPLKEGAWKESLFAQPLSSPSLLLRKGIAYFAAVEGVKTPNARVLRGQIE